METKKRKVLLVVTKSNWGGAQKYVFDLATSLSKETHDVAVVLGGSGPLLDRLHESGVRTIPLRSLQRDINLYKEAKSLLDLYSVMRKEKPDVLHVNSSKTGGLGALAGRLAGIPKIVFTCHGWAFNEERPLLSLWLIRFFSWLTVMFSHVTIAVSGRDETDGKKMPFAKDKMILVHNGVRMPAWKSRDEARASLGIAESDFAVGAIGELHRNKGYEYLLDAFSALVKENPSARLVIIGEGEERVMLEMLAKNLGIRDRVSFPGFIDGAPSYLRAFDAFALTSIKEGLPYAVIEAGFAGLPVVATNVGGVGEIVEDMASGILVQTRKPDDIAQALALIMKSPDRAKSFGDALRQKVESEFSIERMVEKTVAVYQGA